ncbi:hypothetical protein AK812_SmicGene48904, partial [Symbiodinium microadriaticum]
MDPTETELTAITDLAGVFTWGVTGFLEQSLRKALGVPGSVDAKGNPGPLRALTLVEQGTVDAQFE